jgi:TonB-dependent receptor
VDYWQASGELKFGLGLRLREKNNDQFTDKFKAKGTILLSDVDAGGPQVFYDNHYNIGPTPNRYGLIGLTEDSTMTKNSGEDTIGDAEAFQDDNENVYAGYGQYTVTFGRIGVLAGVRLEQTEATYRANQVDENSDTGDITLSARKASYFNYFPTLQGRYEFRKDLIGRVTYSTAIARPGFNQITASTIVSDNSVTIGNPNLKPTTGNNFDGTLEWYPEAGAVASVGVFDKEFRNYILPSQQSDTSYPDVDGVAQITTFSNGSARAYGAESAVTQQLKMLPDPFDGLGISANITLVHSDAEIHPGVHGLLPSTSRVTWNAAGFYEKGPVNVRIAAGFVGQNLFAFGSSPATDIYSRRRLTLDIGSSYAFTHYVKLFFDAKNLLNTPLEFTEGKSDARPIQREFYDITLLGGVRATFE